MDTIKILLATESSIKKDAVANYFAKYHPKLNYTINCTNCDELKLPPQPINCGMHCAFYRTLYAIAHSTSSEADLVIAIESDLVKVKGKYYDRANVRIEAGDIVGVGISKLLHCPIDLTIFESQKEIKFSGSVQGYAKTAGELLAETTECDPKNWMWSLAGIDRRTQIATAVKRAFNDLLTNIINCYEIKQCYKSYADFPKKDVTFKYFYSLFSSNNMNKLARILESKYKEYEIDAVIPLESRGLVLGAVIADRLGITMIPMQKPGKIPGEYVSTTYDKEYGTDEIQVSIDLFDPLVKQLKQHYRFMIVDDLIATGGTIEAVFKILNEVSREYSFSYDCVILALDEVVELRTKVKEKIWEHYDVLFRSIDDTYHKIKN